MVEPLPDFQKNHKTRILARGFAQRSCACRKFHDPVEVYFLCWRPPASFELPCLHQRIEVVIVIAIQMLVVAFRGIQQIFQPREAPRLSKMR